jgi:hypothetical protein
MQNDSDDVNYQNGEFAILFRLKCQCHIIGSRKVQKVELTSVMTNTEMVSCEFDPA